MEDHRNEERQNLNWEDRAPNSATRWLVIVCVTLFAVAIFAVGYAYERTAAANALNDQNQMMRAADAQMRGQIDVLTAKINQMTAPPADAATGATPAATGASAPEGAAKSTARRASAAGSSSQDSRFRQVQSLLAAQQKQLQQAEEEIAGTRSGLEEKLGATRDELNGSIARTHDELVALEKRGERAYTEFDLSKSRGFQHEGPIQVSLRKADARHQSYDLMMLVDDHQLSKKKVDLYEPIWLRQADQPEPVQIVVNQIDRNHIHGYISAPKYRESELASNNAAPPSVDLNAKPSSTPSSDSSSYSSSHTTSIPATAPQAQPRPVD
jgi:hypothetical protein